MGSSNLRKLKKKYRSDTLSSIEFLINNVDNFDYDIRKLKNVFKIAQSFKVGDWGKSNQSNNYKHLNMSWELKEKFSDFIHLRKIIEKNNRSEIYIIDSVNEKCDYIIDKYKLQYRNAIINSIIDIED